MATFKDYAENDLDPRFGGAVKSGGAQKRHIYKLNNRSPKGGDFTPGITMYIPKSEEKSEVVQSIFAVVLFYARNRSLWGKSGLVCQSDDGHRPAARIEHPKCQSATAAEVAEVLSNFKGMERARLDDLTGRLTENTGKLQMCGVAKGDGGCIPVCPMGRGDERGPAPCKEELLLSCYDVERERPFIMRLTGGSIRDDKKAVAPVWKFLARLGKLSVPCYAAQVLIEPLQADSGFYIANFSGEEPVSSELAPRMKELAHEALERFEKRSSLRPEAKKEEFPEQKKVEQTAAQQVFKDDDIDFGEQ